MYRSVPVVAEDISLTEADWIVGPAGPAPEVPNRAGLTDGRQDMISGMLPTRTPLASPTFCHRRPWKTNWKR
jgi:hypothetical protein